MQGERVWVKDTAHKETQKSQCCWSANNTPLRKVIKDSDSFFEREFYIGDIELWEMGDLFRFSPPCCSCLRGPRGVNQWPTHFRGLTTGYSLTQWGNKLHRNSFKHQKWTLVDYCQKCWTNHLYCDNNKKVDPIFWLVMCNVQYICKERTRLSGFLTFLHLWQWKCHNVWYMDITFPWQMFYGRKLPLLHLNMQSFLVWNWFHLRSMGALVNLSYLSKCNWIILFD